LFLVIFAEKMRNGAVIAEILGNDFAAIAK
jgi:hypothetical protein